jgi:16S rRNA (cytidine1402-2'-O)-methyltransferase
VTSPAGTLYLVPTPIGNPRDITLLAIDVLGSVDVIAAEDTRHTRSLLQAVEVQAAALVSYHDHNEQARTPRLLETLRGGGDVALVSDAGTPLLNDPGFRLVTAAIAENIRVCPLPGASATTTALIGSGLPVHEFHYAGFLPRRSAARQAAIKALAGLAASIVFFEAPHRILETLADLRAVLGDRQVALARNLTKPDESFLRGALSIVEDRLRTEDVVRGQFTIVVAGTDGSPADGGLAEVLTRALLHNGVGGRLAAQVVREVTGLPRNEVYRQVQAAGSDGAGHT